MRFISKELLTISVIFICFQSVACAGENPKQEDIKKIEAVIETFRVSLITKDKPIFIDLFYNESVPWLGVASDKTIALAPPAKEGDRERKKVGDGNYTSFIDWIVSTPKAIEEKFWNIKILQDGDIGSVHFKYSFHQDQTKTNWGEEAWQLVRTEQGWKIASVIYSITIKG